MVSALRPIEVRTAAADEVPNVAAAFADAFVGDPVSPLRERGGDRLVDVRVGGQLGSEARDRSLVECELVGLEADAVGGRQVVARAEQLPCPSVVALLRGDVRKTEQAGRHQLVVAESVGDPQRVLDQSASVLDVSELERGSAEVEQDGALGDPVVGALRE